MEREQLQSIQAPLKERYRNEPESALVTLSATGELGEGVSCSVQTGHALAELSVDRDAPVGFSEIRLEFDLESNADQEQLETLRKLTERFCVVFQTLSNPPKLSTRFATD